tara:strand:- start:74 stop:745 length:672 start_codon:yes stop_codon:yes gene_type:complete
MYFGGQAQLLRPLYNAINNPLLAKKFGGFTSEVVKEIIEESLDQNQHLQDYLHFEENSQNLICEMKMEGLKTVEVLVQLCTKFAGSSPIKSIIDGIGSALVVLTDEQLIRFRNYRHIHDLMVLYRVAEDNPGCHWEVDYENPSPDWQGHTAVSFDEWVDTVNPDYYLIRQAQAEEWDRMYEEQAAENDQDNQIFEDEYYRLRDAGYSGYEAEAGAKALLLSFW